jgi:hypothetical protein
MPGSAKSLCTSNPNIGYDILAVLVGCPIRATW